MTTPEAVATAGLMLFAAYYLVPGLADADWSLILRAMWGF